VSSVTAKMVGQNENIASGENRERGSGMDDDKRQHGKESGLEID
jgi:hypothetical protein